MTAHREDTHPGFGLALFFLLLAFFMLLGGDYRCAAWMAMLGALSALMEAL